MGKGAALRTGFAAATGDIVVIQDADLEYDPRDLPALIAADPRRHRRRHVRLAVHRLAAARALLLAHADEPRPDAGVQHAQRPQRHRHGDLLQGVPRRGRQGDRRRGEPLRHRARADRQGRQDEPAHLRGPRQLPAAAPTPRARRSAGKTACAPSTASSSTASAAASRTSAARTRTEPNRTLQPAERAAPDGGAAQLLFDAQQAVVLRDALGAGERAGLDLARAAWRPPGRR